MNNDPRDKNPKNRDPISGATGSHPVGTGVGAAAGGAAGAAAAGAAAGAGMGAAGGPIGMAAGIAIGAVAGGLAGKGVAEVVNPTVEDAYWRENHSRQWYASGRPYDEYRDAYRLGYEGYSRYGADGRTWDELEPDFENEYRTNYGSSGLEWENARQAARAAWNRVAGDHQRLIGYEVQDSADNNIGKVNNLWTDENGQPIFLGVKTGWIFGKNHVVPVGSAEVNAARKLIRLPFTVEQIKNAPAFDEDVDISEYEQDRIFSHYGVARQSLGGGVPPSVREERMETSMPTTAEERTVQLKEEQLKVGKRQVEAGGVRLHKIVRTETINQPVELSREEIVIERVPGNQAATPDARFEDEDIFIPLRREEPVVQKEARVREEVRVGKKTEIDRQQVTEQVRKEDLQVDKNLGTKTRR